MGLSRLYTKRVGAALAVVLLYLAIRGIEWHDVVRIVARADAIGLLLTGAMGVVALLLRALRWRLLLNVDGHASIRIAFLAVAAGQFGNSLLPARAGDIIRSVLVSSRCGMQTAFVLTTAIVERIVDGIALVSAAAIILLVMPLPVGWLSGALKTSAGLGLAGALAILAAPFCGPSIARVAMELRLPVAVRSFLTAIVEQGVRGFRVFHDVGRVARFVAITGAIWCLDASAVIVGGLALGLHIPIEGAFLLLAGLGLASAVPSTPGFLGVYQLAAVSTLTPFGLSRADAIAYIIVVQALMLVVMGLFGMVGLFAYRRSHRPGGNGDRAFLSH